MEAFPDPSPCASNRPQYSHRREQTENQALPILKPDPRQRKTGPMFVAGSRVLVTHGTRNNVQAIWVRQGSIPGEFIRKEPQMDDDRKSSKAGKRAAEGLREATAKEEAKNESKMGHDLAKGADRFEALSKSSDGKSAEEKQKG